MLLLFRETFVKPYFTLLVGGCRTRSRDAASFASHNFDEASGCLARAGVGRKDGYVFLVKVGHLESVDFLFAFGGETQIGLDGSGHTSGCGNPWASLTAVKPIV